MRSEWQSGIKGIKKKRKKSGDLSVVALNKYGEIGVATNIDGFSFVFAKEGIEPKVYITHVDCDGKTSYDEASEEWLEDYMRTRTSPLKLKK